jgi:hypothetical protein
MGGYRLLCMAINSEAECSYYILYTLININLQCSPGENNEDKLEIDESQSAFPSIRQ